MICLVSVSFEQKRDILGLLESVDIMILRLTSLFLLLTGSVGVQSIINIIPRTNFSATGTYHGIAGMPGDIGILEANDIYEGIFI
jgi:hypothetical protein